MNLAPTSIIARDFSSSDSCVIAQKATRTSVLNVTEHFSNRKAAPVGPHRQQKPSVRS